MSTPDNKPDLDTRANIERFIKYSHDQGLIDAAIGEVEAKLH